MFFLSILSSSILSSFIIFAIESYPELFTQIDSKQAINRDSPEKVPLTDDDVDEQSDVNRIVELQKTLDSKTESYNLSKKEHEKSADRVKNIRQELKIKQKESEQENLREALSVAQVEMLEKFVVFLDLDKIYTPLHDQLNDLNRAERLRGDILQLKQANKSLEIKSDQLMRQWKLNLQRLVEEKSNLLVISEQLDFLLSKQSQMTKDEIESQEDDLKFFRERKTKKSQEVDILTKNADSSFSEWKNSRDVILSNDIKISTYRKLRNSARKVVKSFN